MAAAAEDPAALPHGNHDPAHGGIVFMKGDLHFEVALSRSGTHRIYFSDAVRAELPAATASEVTLAFSTGEAAAETLNGQVDDTGESWIIKGQALRGGGIVARVSFVVNGEPYWIDVPFVDEADRQAAVP